MNRTLWRESTWPAKVKLNSKYLIVISLKDIYHFAPGKER